MGFQRRLRRGHKEQPVQLELFERILRGTQMAEMNRIETAAEKTDFHRGGRLVPPRSVARIDLPASCPRTESLTALKKTRRVPPIPALTHLPRQED